MGNRPIKYTMQPVADNAAGIRASAVAAGAGSVGPFLATDFRYPAAQPRQISFTAAGNESARTFTVTGFDAAGNPVRETLAGPNANTVKTRYIYSVLSDVTIDAASGAFSMGWSAPWYSPWFSRNRWHLPEVTMAVRINGATVNFTVQHSLQPDLLRNGPDAAPNLEDVANDPGIAAATADAQAESDGTIRGVATRLVVNTYTSGGPLEFFLHPHV